ncbi:MAG: ATP-binding protein [Bacteroidota bacterium]
MLRISLKNKLFLGFGFLFLMIILIWIVGSYFIYNLSDRSAAMLSENYQTVESTKFLIQAIDEIKNQQVKFFFDDRKQFDDSSFTQSQKTFDEHLRAVRNNITEEGEKSIIDQLEINYLQYKKSFEQVRTGDINDLAFYFHELVPEYSVTRNLIIELWDMNMVAISFKNSLLKNTAHKAFVYISIIGTVCFLISAFFLFRYPRNIANPIGELIRGITEIANRNYSKRLSFQSNDELGELAKAFNTMAAKLDEFEHSNLSELLFEKKRIDTIINNMNDAIIGLNEKKVIIFSNANACKILGLDENILIGKYAPDIAVKNPIFQTVVSGILDKPINIIKDFKPLRIEQKGRVRYYAREVLNVIITKTGEYDPVRAGLVIVLKNITHFLEQDEAKTNFMATISHELKTPISSLRLNLKLLDDNRVGSLNNEQNEIVQALKLETNKMQNLTKELLDLAQLESGNIQLNLQTLYTSELFELIRETSENYGKSKHIHIEFKTESNLPPVYADSEKTAWALINLINNAIQYSEEGSKVHVVASKHDNEVVYSVQDYGKGIDNKYHDLIFQKFYRVPNTIESGTGLGLSISKEFITKQNGKIWVESSPGEGSRFYISLPVYGNFDSKTD